MCQLQERIKRAAKFVKKTKPGKNPKSTGHKIVIVSSFFRALKDKDKGTYSTLIDLYKPLAGVPLDAWCDSAEYKRLSVHFHELQQQ